MITVGADPGRNVPFLLSARPSSGKNKTLPTEGRVSGADKLGLLLSISPRAHEPKQNLMRKQLKKIKEKGLPLRGEMSAIADRGVVGSDYNKLH